MRQRVDLGVFLPVARGGFLMSTASPAYEPSYRDLLEITQLAERIGFDYAFSMLKWRGFGGAGGYWDESLESCTLTAALAAATEQICLIATVNPVLYHPALVAKAAATIDDISCGRLALNIITGATLGEYEQMGVLPDGYDTGRYAFATEWVQVLKRLWTEPSVTHHGEHFHLDDCVMAPKPVQSPHPPLVCAGSSDEGLRFTVREADQAFFRAGDVGAVRALSSRVRSMAAEEGRSTRTSIVTNIVLRDTRADAEDWWDHLVEGADVEAMAAAAAVYSGLSRERTRELGEALTVDKRRISPDPPILGGPDEVADALIELAVDGDLDSIMLTFPDYIDGLTRFGATVMPRLREVLDVGPRANA